MNELPLLHNYDKRDLTDVEWIQEFFDFLQGELPDSIRMKKSETPKLSSQKAASVIWYLQEHLPLIPSNIEYCSYCGAMFDSNQEGGYWEAKEKCFCDACNWRVPKKLH